MIRAKNLVTTDFLPLARPFISDDDLAVVTEVLRSGQLVQGKYVAKLEEAVASYHGVRHAIAMSNGTATLHLTLLALGIGAGDEVLVPAFSFIATANVVELVGARCVFVDIDKHTFNLNVSLLEEKITPHTKAIIPVHQFGLCCDIAAVCALAEKHRLHVIEDAACALGATANGRRAGTFGVAGSFSLHPRKNITAGEGGVVITDNDTLARRLRQLRNHGMETQNGQVSFEVAGYNYRLTDFGASLAWSQFRRLEKILEVRQQRVLQYLSLIKQSDFRLPVTPTGSYHTWQTFHLLLPGRLDQQEVIQFLKAKSIGSNYGAQCIPDQTHFRHKYKLNSRVEFPNASEAYRQGLALPLFEGITECDITKVANALNEL